MKYASAGLIAFLNSNAAFLMADLLTITLQGGGTVYRWTNGDQALIVGGNTYTPAVDAGGQPIFSRGPVRNVRGLEVDTLDLTLSTGDTAQLIGMSLPLACHNGLLDAARVRIERLFMPTYGYPSLGPLIMFEGNSAGVDPGSTQTVLHVKSDLERLQLPLPARLFGPNCPFAFGDANCGVALAPLTSAGAAAAGSSASQITGVTGHPDGYYALGVVAMTSGAANGQRRSVKSYIGGIVTPAVPFSSAVASGDTFSIVPGCGRTQAACIGWSNLTRFGGDPFIPAPETTV